MDKFVSKLIALLCCIVCGVSSTYAQGSLRGWSNADYVKVGINTGDPKFPFPQFLEYKTGKSLAANNAEGVTHADMEKTLREAYEIMSHRCRYDGGTHCGVPYITFNNFRKFGETNMPHGGAQFCTEGDGYMMLAAAIFADQATFNGLWMWIHDNRIPHRIRYQDGKERLPKYEFGGGLPACYALEDSPETYNDGSATDGDDDIAMALLIAYKQWGEFMMQDGKPVLDFNGKPISYKEAAADFLKSFVDTCSYFAVNGDGTIYNGGQMSGNIGVDGYVKGGNKGAEVSTWRLTQTTYPDISSTCNIGGVGGDGNTHTDYCAPAYYNEFAKWLESGEVENVTDWQINQYKRAEASSDWLCGQIYEQGGLTFVGTTNMSEDGKPKFTQFDSGEDFRTTWRMAQNYLWHGNPEYTWNPTTHQVEEGGNTYEYDMALRLADFMKKPLGRNSKMCEDLGASPDPGQPNWEGPALIQQSYTMDGKVQMAASSNYALGCASLSGVISGDLQLVADLYRHSELRWDDASTDCCTLSEEDRYLMSMPIYFHGWFRCLGLLINSGNWHAPSNMDPAANVKVYMSVNKTYAYVDDKVTYTVQYRNYGSKDASGVKIETVIDPNYEVVNISNGGKFSGGKIVWDINSIPGFKSGKLEETIDSVQFTVIVKDTLNPRICLTSKISGANFPSWVSNEYPNHATYTMERNCVDILASRTLQLDKKASRTKMNPGDLVNFTVSFENKSLGESAYLNGGRDNVRLSYGNYIPPFGAWKFYQYYRFWNDADEAYINLENYRVSYYMNDAAAIGLHDANDNPTGWTFRLDNGGDMKNYGWMPEGKETKFTHQKIPNNSDSFGSWNQRLMIQFPGALMGSSTWVYEKLNHFDMLHKGGFGPCYFRTTLNANPEVLLDNRVLDDWSYSPDLQINDLDGQKEIYTLISPCWANLNDPGYEVTTHARSVCSPVDQPNYSRVLVEEYDGYTWRRILGKGPLPGREASNVVVVDTIPYELEWVCWIDSTALKNEAGEKVKATYTPAANPKTDGYTGIVRWTIPAMFVGEKDKLVYTCKARDLGCPDVDDAYYMNVAWISSETDSPDSSRVELMTTCVLLPPQPEAQDALFKRSSKKKAMDGDDVSYNVVFKNTVGTVVEADCKSTTGWHALAGSTIGNVSGSGFELKGEHMYGPDKSYGKNGWVTFSVEDASNTTGIYLVFRHSKGKPGDANFEGIAIQLIVNDNMVNNLGYRVYDNGKMIDEAVGSGKNMQFRGDNKKPTFKFQLFDDCLSLYCNDEDDEWINVSKTWCNLSCTKAGEFGIYTKDNNGPPHMIKYSTELDYAFDITLSDSLPAELTDITNISDDGVYDAATHSIIWPTFATTNSDAMAPGDSIVYSFDATVKNCEKFINNYAYADVYGIKRLSVIETIECGAIECDLPEKIVAELKQETICDGDSTYIKVIKPKKSNNLTYEYFFGSTSLNDETPIKVDSFFLKKAGKYSVTVSNPEIEGCVRTSDVVKLTVNDLPTETLENSPALCEGEGLDLTKPTIDGYELNWYNDDKAIFPIVDLKPEGDEVLDVYYYTVTDENGCVSKPQEMTVSKEAIPLPPTVETPVELATSSNKVVLDRYVTVQTENSKVAWYKSKTDETTLLTPGTSMKVPFEEKGDTTFYVSAISPGGCESERVEIEIHISDSNKPKVSNATLCAVADTIDVTSLAETPTEGELVWCDENGTPLSAEDVAALSSFTSETPGEATFYVKSVNGPAESEIATITITTVGVAKAITEDVTYCKDRSADQLSATIDASSTSSNVKADDPSMFEWYDGKVKLAEEALTPSLSAIASTSNKTKEYKVVPTYTIEEGHVCKGDTVSLNVSVNVVEKPAVLSSIAYSLGDTLANGKFKDLLSQNSNAIISGAGLDLVWYDEDGTTSLATTPTPSVDKAALENDDIALKYYVSQKDGDCESDKIEVDVLISAMKTPTVKPIKFCEDDNENFPSKNIEDYVIPTEATYTLKWYDGDKQPLSDGAPRIITGKTTANAVDTIRYYVSQVNEENKESSKVPVNIHIYARPRLKAHFDTVCSKSVSLDNMWIVSNDVKETVFSKYQDATGLPLDDQATINATGHYKAIGYFMIPNVSNYMCVSDTPEDIYVEIHNIESLDIDGAQTACPGGTVELDAILKGDTYQSDITYTWSHNNNSSSAATGNFVSDALNEPTTFEVTVSDGYCTKKATKSVSIGQGEVKGTIVFTDHDGTTESITADGYPITFYTCGDVFSLFADLASDDNRFDWSNGETSSAIRLTTPGKYIVSFTNKCEASQTIIVEDAAIRNNTIANDKVLCEGDKYEMVLDFTCDQSTTIEWKKDNDIVGTANKISIASASTNDNGLYSYTIKNDYCEVSTSYGELSVSEAPKYTLLTNKDTTICNGEDVFIGLATLTPEIGTNLAWESNTTLTPKGKLVALAKPIETTTYRFTVSQAGGCELKDSITVDVEEPLEFTMAESDITVCLGDPSVRLSANIIKGKPRKYSWMNEAGEELSTSPVYRVPTDIVGETTYRLSISNGICNAEEGETTVTVIGIPTISSVIQRSFRDVEIIPSPDNETSSVKYMIDKSDVQESTLFSGLKYGSHVAFIIDSYGCTSDFPFTTNSPDIEFPTVVTPNGDGDNDAFISETVAEAYPDARITIYDRFGKKLTEIKGDESWDGMYLGHKMPTTDYWYEIWIEEIRKKYVGHFTLINE